MIKTAPEERNPSVLNDEPQITPELVARHGLTPEEYERFVGLVGRTPTLCELGIVSAMWNEHCSYKSSKPWLKTLPTEGPHVIHGPGENAGVVDIGDGLAVVFKMESHNHPSYIEPHQGAATGVGGILRDVFTMGARPVAVLNALRFGQPDHPRTRHVVSGVVAGVGGYGNAFGVPTVGGETEFDASYDGNCLVNAMAVGIVKTDAIFLSEAKGVGRPVVYLGSKTGRDGIHGATMASATFESDNDTERSAVQVGDPFSGKRLLEASLELMATGAVIAIQDMGAAGLTSSAVEMGAKGNLGIHLNLDDVPCRETGMTAYEMMLSESQERMLMVLDPDHWDEAQAIFKKWELDSAIVGETADDLRFKVFHNGKQEADLPIKDLGDEAPVYDRPHTTPPLPEPMTAAHAAAPADLGAAILEMVGSANGSSRRWVTEQYDTVISGNVASGPGGDAAVVRLGDGPQALAICVDVTPRYCFADPFEGGKQAVAEVWRNLTSVGADPLAITDNLNFGSPQRPEIMAQFVGCIKGIGEASRALEFPVVSGNVSLYNETDGTAILPTPAIGGVGTLDIHQRMGIAWKAGDTLFIVGGHGEHLGASLYLQIAHGGAFGPPPPVDLAREKAHGDFVREAIRGGLLSACHDISSGGLAMAAVEMALASGVGARLDLPLTPHVLLFAEDQARYVVATDDPDALMQAALDAKIGLAPLGMAGGDQLTVPGARVSLAALSEAHEAWFPAYMARQN
ncbi:phosphoribosylformylglycinamidine synthase subunit PurL [Acuticoccus sp. MNP-M23]|uniref:phosphoribosylformylglycinamidine synthase subunit PurL n=1 Tax=Acuticoccus sp. MNP-M23 TaxID=3072793 RepID=UPI00281570F1|nr:phosphoribosylformylglycinamidine synthase subunit PurL [Acuticoccus sp. MNP-M23]WMS42198.1 phosphoribosylformylglycinamidine synthase subunit PurL [Acuticoccus sp. MNP-M23]